MSTINKSEHTRLLKQLYAYRLKDTLSRLNQEAMVMSDWNLQTRIDNLRQTYDALLSYAATGATDPERDKILLNIQRAAAEITDLLYLHHEAKNCYGDFWNRIQNQLKTLGQQPDYAQLIEQLRANLRQVELIPDTPDNAGRQEKDRVVREAYEQQLDQLFYAVWCSLHWSETEYNTLCDHLLHTPLPEYDTAVVTSAIAQSLLICFDPYKFRLLTELYHYREELQVNQRALIGIALTVYYHEERFKLYPTCQDALQDLLDDEIFVQQLGKLQIQLLMSRETEKISSRMHQEIFPDLLNYKLGNPDTKITSLEELEEYIDENPEWKSRMNKLTDKMRELGEMQQEGADTNMYTFTTLKSYPFFRRAPHWFYPFNTHQSDIADILGKYPQAGQFLRFINSSGMYCNSDLYSLLFTLQQVSGIQEGKNIIPMELSELGEQLENAQEKQENPDSVRRQYLQDVYRFYKLWQFKSYQDDIFKDDLALWHRQSLAKALQQPELLEHIAHFLFSKDYFSEAAELYTQLSALPEAKAEYLQKLGFCYQKQGKYSEALQAYQKAELLLSADDTWNNLHIAQCYRQLHQYEEALTYYLKVTEAKPDNLNAALQAGHCLAALRRYQEALKYYFKVEFLGKTPANAHRAIGWCYFMTGQPQKAEEYYQKVLDNESKILPSDYMNMGHALLVQKRIADALTYYHRAYAVSKDDFYQTLQTDTPALLEQGVSASELHLLPDLLM